MASVTSRIKNIQQPYGGYLPVNQFQKCVYSDEFILGEENIHAGLIGITVDYLSRFLIEGNREAAFSIALLGAEQIKKKRLYYRLLNQVNGLDDASIIAACKLSGFDVCYRVGSAYYKPVETITPDSQTIENIRIMVTRICRFYSPEAYGPVIVAGFSFEGGYTSTISSGDGDYLTTDTLWDVKTNKRPPTSSHTLQILIYYLMGLHSIHPYFKAIKHLGIFNPRMNISYIIDTEQISPKIIHEVIDDVICYNSSNTSSKNPDEMTVTQVANVLKCSTSMVRKLIRQGLLPAEKKNRHYVVSYEDVLNFIDAVEMVRKKQKREKIIKTIIYVILCTILFFCFLLRS